MSCDSTSESAQFRDGPGAAPGCVGLGDAAGEGPLLRGQCLLGLGWGFLYLDPTMLQGHPGSEGQQLRLESVALAPGPEAGDPRPNQARFSVSKPPDLLVAQRSLARQQSHS